MPSPESTTNPSSVPEAIVQAAREDLAQRLNISVEQIEVIEARAVVWPDGSIGCPQPGMAYVQVQQEGALVRLSAEGKIYAYHSGGGRAPFLCENPAKDSGLSPGGEELIPPSNPDT